MVFSHFSVIGMVAASITNGAWAHPGVPALSEDILRDFGPHMRCPHAEKWLTKGPDVAWKEYLDHHRHLEESTATVVGSCAYTNMFSSQPACVEFRGAAWSAESMQARCDQDDTKGSLSAGAPCALPAELAGWCVKELSTGLVEAMPLTLDGSVGCEPVKGVCQTFIGGVFKPSENCQLEDGADAPAGPPEGSMGGGFDFGFGTAGSGPVEQDPSVTCDIAPGPIGAAHQAAYSSGYRRTCENTPAEESPYMWPLMWSADVENQNVPFQSDEVLYQSKGKVFYRLDKNWKRLDILKQNGTQRSIGQSPCPEEMKGDLPFSCIRDNEDRITMIHRGALMFFLYWANGTAYDNDDVANIVSCTKIDLRVVGNIRPDWFMDIRGDSTDTQYLGNQHVYYPGNMTGPGGEKFVAPRLVKQWRKKDFASQYFTMSMQENPGSDGVRWPLVLNIPGEGFGDDSLQFYSNHQLLSEDSEDLFLLDEAYLAAGGSCNDRASGGGPPVGQFPHIPSNLEVDPYAWFSNVYTFSPIWERPTKEDVPLMSATTTPGTALTAPSDVVSVESCYDETTASVRLAATFQGMEPSSDGRLPWMALAYRETEECLMTPRGKDGEIILMSDHLTDDGLSVWYGPLPSRFSAGIVEAINTGVAPLQDAEGFSEVMVSKSEDGTSATLKFKRVVEGGTAPEVLNLTYAIGSSPEIAYHANRECFEVTAFPPCPVEAELEAAQTRQSTGEDQDTLFAEEQMADVMSSLASSAFALRSLYGFGLFYTLSSVLLVALS